MKRLFFTLTALALFSLPSLTLASNWKIDSDHSAAQFRVQHMMIAHVQGNFPQVEGVAVIDDEDITRSTVEVTIDAASIDTGVEKRDAHLKSADFFDVAQHPAITFRSNRVEEAADRLRVHGDLTIHGVTRKVELLVSKPGAGVKDPWGNIRRGAKATTSINRKDFGIVWNATLDNGGLLIGEDVEIVIDLELIRQAG